MLKVGSRVRYIHEDTDDDKVTGYYPPIGTMGTVVAVYERDCRVQWDSGTREGAWYCDFTDVEEVYTPLSEREVQQMASDFLKREVKWKEEMDEDEEDE